MTVVLEQTKRGKVVRVGGDLAWLLARLSLPQIEKLKRFASALLNEEPRALESDRSRRARESAFEERQMPNALEAARTRREP